LPFTISHLAAAKPLRRILGKKVTIPALAIGSIMPDLIYFIPIAMSRDFSHSIIGLFLFNLPAALLLLYLFQYIGRAPLVDILPNIILKRINLEKRIGSKSFLRNIPADLIGLAAGVCGHILWDNLTHESWITELLPGHRMNIFFIYRVMPLYKALQHLSSLLGLVAVFYFIWRWISRTGVQTSVNRSVSDRFVKVWRWIIFSISFCLPLISGFLIYNGNSNFTIFRQTLYIIIFGGGNLFVFLVGSYILNWWIVVSRMRTSG